MICGLGLMYVGGSLIVFATHSNFSGEYEELGMGCPHSTQITPRHVDSRLPESLMTMDLRTPPAILKCSYQDADDSIRSIEALGYVLNVSVRVMSVNYYLFVLGPRSQVLRVRVYMSVTI